MEVRLLGPVDLMDDAGIVRSPGSGLRRTLLALLGLRAGEVLSADWLLEHTWGGAPPESGLKSLRFHIHRLRDELGDDGLIETRPGGYRLALSTERVDALAVEAMVERARQEADRGLAAEMYGEVLAMWRGVPFVDASPCSILDDEAGRLAELRLRIIEDRFQARLDSGAGRELVADLSRATSQHPLRESLWSMLITALYRAGLQADALRSYEEMRAMLADTLGLDPSSELQNLQRRVLQHDPSLLGADDSSNRDLDPDRGRQSGHVNLPALATPLIDSDDQLGLASTLLHNHRQITLTGAGGVGKTRLAIELGWSRAGEFKAGVWLVELATVQNPDLVVAVVASTLSIRPQQGMSNVEAITDWLKNREVLLIIDNCEHLLDATRELVAALLARCPTVKVVVTSREPLGIGGERVHRVTTLDPDCDGLALFVDRASAADSSFVANDIELSIVNEICRRLDGLPFAIELAAVRVRSMALVDLLARLDDRFKLLRVGARQNLDHRETLLTTVEWSYRLLTEHEQAMFDRLSVFSGGFDLRAAEVVCSVDDIDESDVVDLLRDLVDKSMVAVDRNPNGTRYRMLETLRQFGKHKLGTRGGTADARERHLRHYVDVAEQADILWRSQLTSATTFDREWSNLREAHDWAILTEDLPIAERLIIASRLHAESRMRFEHGDWVERTIALGTPEHPPTPDTYAQGAFWAYNRESLDHAWELLQRGIELLETIDGPGAALCLRYLEPGDHPRVPNPFRALELAASKLDLDREWWVLIDLTDFAARYDPSSEAAHVDRLVTTANRIGGPLLKAQAALARGRLMITRSPPDFVAALEIYAPARDTARDNGELVSEGDCLRAIALATVGLDPGAAIHACREALMRLYEIRYWYRIWQLFDSIALALASTNHIEAAAVVVGHLEAHHPPFGVEHLMRFRSRTLEIVRTRSEVDAWIARGAAIDRHQIVEYALAELGQYDSAETFTPSPRGGSSDGRERT